MPLTHSISRSTWYLLVVIYVSMFAAVGANVAYTNRVAQDTDRQWCGVLRIYHDAYANNPEPPTQLGRDIKVQLEQLYAQFHCATVGKP